MSPNKGELMGVVRKFDAAWMLRVIDEELSELYEDFHEPSYIQAVKDLRKKVEERSSLTIDEVCLFVDLSALN
jgi:hypothetical protein